MGPMGKSHEQFDKWAAQYGPCFRFFQGRHPCVVLNGELTARLPTGLWLPTVASDWRIGLWLENRPVVGDTQVVVHGCGRRWV